MALETGLDGQVAVVVGGTSGIGRAIAARLHEEGATVVPTSRSEERVAAACESVDCDLLQPTDVTSRPAVRTLFERVHDEVGPPNVLVNSAGVVQEAKPVERIEDDEWDRIVETNLYGVFLAAQLFPEFAADEGERSILNVGSMNGEAPVSGLTAYGASKFGVKGLTQYLALEYAPEVRVNAVAPGYVKTRQNEEALDDPDTREAIHRRTPLSRHADAGEIADAAAYLASPLAGFVTGETLVIDGGFTLR